MNLNWVRCRTYDEAKNYAHIIYVHIWDDKVFYCGKAHNSFFGGGTRSNGESKMSGRYSYWIEGCLQRSAKLYICVVPKDGPYTIKELENFLISISKDSLNKIRNKSLIDYSELKNTGDVPKFLDELY